MNSAMLDKEPESIAIDPNEILTVHQAAQVLKVSYSHMLRLIRGEESGMPPVYRLRMSRRDCSGKGGSTLRKEGLQSAILSGSECRASRRCRSRKTRRRSSSLR